MCRNKSYLHTNIFVVDQFKLFLFPNGYHWTCNKIIHVQSKMETPFEINISSLVQRIEFTIWNLYPGFYLRPWQFYQHFSGKYATNEDMASNLVFKYFF